MTSLQATLCRTYDNAPLATVHGLPGDGADLSPAELRALARALDRIAADAEAKPTTGKHYTPQRLNYPLTNPA